MLLNEKNMEVTIQCFVESYSLGTVNYQFAILINH